MLWSLQKDLSQSLIIPARSLGLDVTGRSPFQLKRHDHCCLDIHDHLSNLDKALKKLADTDVPLLRRSVSLRHARFGKRLPPADPYRFWEQ